MQGRQFLPENHEGRLQIPLLKQLKILLLADQKEHLMAIGTL